MSLSGSVSESNAKTNDIGLMNNDIQGPEPTRENPAGVFPQVGTQPAESGSIPGSGAPDHGGDVRGVFGNPEMFNDTFRELSTAFTTAMNKIQDESGSGIGSVGKTLISKLEKMRNEIDDLRSGKGLEEVKEAGGERNDSVERAQGDGGGLYKD
ncbi:uncharacterized protein L201_006096 [Kwoniella dendrophila CBS 6074]|uniref:Uncharacterized protein n=1 Tax=Kwoniella dendrophila CBS 6074 TaxID=1295534 RepID=A0AAX4K2V7_9TREE